VEEIESHFWETLGNSPPGYMKNLHLSLFGKDVKEWNLQNLDTTLSRHGGDRRDTGEGLKSSYLYFGSRGSFLDGMLRTTTCLVSIHDFL
jgi:hypothetical protein